MAGHWCWQVLLLLHGQAEPFAFFGVRSTSSLRPPTLFGHQSRATPKDVVSLPAHEVGLAGGDRQASRAATSAQTSLISISTLAFAGLMFFFEKGPVEIEAPIMPGAPSKATPCPLSFSALTRPSAGSVHPGRVAPNERTTAGRGPNGGPEVRVGGF